MQRKYNFPVINFEATRRCNLSCNICMVGSNQHDVVEKSTKQELSCDEIVKYILKPAQELGAYQIQYSGGEFLLRDDALAIVTKTIEMGYEPRILTNGTHISDDLLKTLKAIAGRKIVLVFGINSISNQLINKNTRNIADKVFFRALELCKKYQIKRHVVVNIGQFNLTDLQPTFQWLADNKITFNRSPFSARMSGKEYFQKMGFSADDMKNYIHPALRKQVNGYASYTPFFLSPELHTEVSGGNSRNVTVPQNPLIGCWIGSWLSISAEGNVAPCVLLGDELNAGNVREKSLYEIIDDSEIFQNLLNRYKLKGKCGRCRYKITCGGCRAMAYYHTHDYLAEDPTCFFEPEDESTVSEFEKETNALFVNKYLKMAMYGGIYKPIGKRLLEK